MKTLLVSTLALSLLVSMNTFGAASSSSSSGTEKLSQNSELLGLKNMIATYQNKHTKKAESFLDNVAFTGSIALSPDDQLLAYSSGYGTINLYNLAKEKPIKVFEVSGDHDVRSIAFSPDSKLLAYGSRDGTISLFDTVTQKTKILKGHTEPVLSIIFRSDYGYFANLIDSKCAFISNSGQETILWDTTSEKHVSLKGEKQLDTAGHIEIYRLPYIVKNHVNANTAVTVSSTDKSIFFWDLTDPKQLEQLQAQFNQSRLILSPDGTKMASYGYKERSEILLWNLHSQKCITSWRHKNAVWRVTSAAFSKNNTKFAILIKKDVKVGEKMEDMILVWQLPTAEETLQEKCIRTIQKHQLDASVLPAIIAEKVYPTKDINKKNDHCVIS